MAGGNALKTLFLKSPLFRWSLIIAVILLCVAVMGGYLRYFKVTPVVESIDPPIATGGDILTITGKGFSRERDTGYVEIGGNPITGSGYLSWSDEKIVLRLPANIKDGLVVVVTSEGRSEPQIFSNSVYVPMPVRTVPAAAKPKITGINTNTASPGKLLVIKGEHFGETKNNGMVRFSPARSQANNGGDITPPQGDFDYDLWSDSEIRVRVPDGAVSGTLSVVTDRGESSPERITVTSPPGTKTFDDTRTYLVNVSADITDMAADDAASLILRVPRPQVNATQRRVELRECVPDPVIQDYNNMVIHQVQAQEIGREKRAFSQNFIITVNAVTTVIDPEAVAPFSERGRMLYRVYTAPDPLVPSDDESLAALAKEIVRSETNPYKRARLVYDYMLSNFSLLGEVRSGNPSPLDMLYSGRGDAYDFAIVFAALLRSLGIPCKPAAGVLVENRNPTDLRGQQAGSLYTRNHWWDVFYIENFGWIPVDPALGAGLQYAELRRHSDRASYYFGSLDSQHIEFSNTWKAVKPSLVNSKSVYRPRSYAFQSIWEEASATVREYSSFWSDPIILAMY